MTSTETQDETARVLKEGARLLYTVAAGQFFELGDVNAWFERYNALTPQLGQGFEDERYGVIGARSSDSDPLVDQAGAALNDLVARATAQRDDFETAVAAARQGGGA